MLSPVFLPTRQICFVKVTCLTVEGWDVPEDSLQICTSTKWLGVRWGSECLSGFLLCGFLLCGLLLCGLLLCGLLLAFPDAVLSMPCSELLIKYPEPINLKGTKLAIGPLYAKTQSGWEKSTEKKKLEVREKNSLKVVSVHLETQERRFSRGDASLRLAIETKRKNQNKSYSLCRHW